MSLIGGESDSPLKPIVITPELKEEFPLKSHHAKLSFECTFCHVGQGDDPKEFTYIGDEGCLSCHQSKEHMAERLAFMDKLHVNPHNSIHDGPTLYCDECHNEHKPSTNMCTECHEHDIDLWMRPTP
nr:cytochrome c3 family protein [Sulfurospirillum tamanensis]